MSRIQVRALLLAVWAGLALSACAGGAVAEPLSGTDKQKQTAPQVTPLPPSEHKGVIEPPDIGDEEIYTDVPDPDAGHSEEVIPPSEIPEQTPE